MQITLGRVVSDLMAGLVVTVEGSEDQLVRLRHGVVAWARAEGHHAIDLWTRPCALRMRLYESVDEVEGGVAL